ncbi:DgyrCDS6958 [Dimorphilus gyrociliatus]|nr:DgyrCDS6958 [Dimorphilus gyrociliatus]
MFESEFQSIIDIRSTKAIQVPNPIKVLKHPDRGAMFAVDWIENLKPVEKLWSKLGEQVADLHLDNPKKLMKERKEANVVGKYEKSIAVSKFGYNYSSYMGPTFKIEANRWFDDWETCFCQTWLKAQFDEVEKKFGNRELIEKWSLLERKLPEFFKDAFFWPSLNHGDLCSINIGEVNEDIVIYDPMCSYSPLEADHTIIQLENNFGKEFHEVYWKKVNNYVSNEKLKLRMELYKIFALLLCSVAENDKTLIKQAIEIINSIILE